MEKIAASDILKNIYRERKGRHLKQRDELKHDNFMEKIAASDILKNIYRERKGTTYDLVWQKQLMIRIFLES